MDYANFGVLELSHGHAPETANLFAEALSLDPRLRRQNRGWPMRVERWVNTRFNHLVIWSFGHLVIWSEK